MPNHQTPVMFAPRQKHVLPALLAAAILCVAASPAQAGCAGPVAKDAAGTTVSIGKSITSAGLMITQAFIELNDSLTRYANQISNNDQGLVESQQSLTDSLSAQENAGTLGEVRTQFAAQMIPSKVVCGIVSRQRTMNATNVQYAAYRTTLQNTNTAYSNNAPGSGSERGTLQAMTTGFSQRCTRYANPATMSPPAGLACPGPADATMRDLDIQPWKAILDPIMFTTPARLQAANDAIKMLTELAPPDPIRGNALLRQEGQNLHVMRMRDVTRMNLARGVLEGIVAMRTYDATAAATAPTSKSRLARYIELITGQEFDPTTNSISGQLPVIMAAQEPANAAVQTLSARFATGNALTLEMTGTVEQLLAIDATLLAIAVERSRSSGASVAALPVSN